MTHSQASDAESSTWTAIPRVAEGNVRKFILAVIAVTALACGGGSDKSTGPNAAVAGTYTLRTINGQILPVIIDQEGNDKLEITGGTVTLNSDLSFVDATTYRLTLSGQVTSETDTGFGTYVVTGNNVTFNLTSPVVGSYSMAWNGSNQLTQVETGATLIYQR